MSEKKPDIYGMMQPFAKEKVTDLNKNKTAIALMYNPDDIAPRVIASGKGYLAEKIIDSANREKIPVHEDAKLAKTLSHLQIGEAIPEELYEVVAEVLVFVDAVDRIKGKM